LRWWVDPSRVYRTIRPLPAVSGFHNALRFWEQHRANGPSQVGHDPLLGWDFDIQGDRIRGVRRATWAADDLGIVALGDSFTYGNEVGPRENFSALIDARPGFRVLNMAIPGYGIGQACLKYAYYGTEHNPDVVLFGIYVDDYHRTSLGFTSSAKPYFAISPAGLGVLGQPVPTPAEQIGGVQRQLDQRRSVLWDALQSLWLKATTGPEQEAAYFDATDLIVTELLRQLGDSLGSHQRLIVIHIPRAEHFVDPDPFRAAMGKRLKGIYEALDIEHIDLEVEFLNGANAQQVFDRYYVHRSSGSVGHFSTAGHQRVMELVLQRLKAGR